MPEIWKFVIDFALDVACCPWLYHLNRWQRRTNVMSFMSSFCSSVTPQIQWIMTWSLWRSRRSLGSFGPHVSLPWSIAKQMQASQTLPCILGDRCLEVRNELPQATQHGSNGTIGPSLAHDQRLSQGLRRQSRVASLLRCTSAAVEQWRWHQWYLYPGSQIVAVYLSCGLTCPVGLCFDLDSWCACFSVGTSWLWLLYCVHCEHCYTSVGLDIKLPRDTLLN